MRNSARFKTYQRAYQRDRYWQQRDAELDSYGAAMSFDPVKTPEEAMIEREEADILAKAMLKLPARRERVLRAHYGINVEPMTLRQIGETFGVTGAAVNAIEYKALRTLKHPKTGLLKKLRPERYTKVRADLDAIAKQNIADDLARVERERQADRERHERKWDEQNDAAVAAARWARAKERLAKLDEARRVANFAQWKRDQQDLFDRLHAEAQHINSLWDNELLRREIAAEQERELAEKRREAAARPSTRQRDWLFVATRKIA